MTKSWPVKTITSQSAGQQTVRYERVHHIELYRFAGVHQVRVFDRSGEAVFYWGCSSLDDAQRLADAITAMADGHGAPAAARPPAAKPTAM